MNCLKGIFWEHPSAGYMLTCPKHSWYLLERSFTLFSHHFEMNWVRKMSLLVRSEILRLFFNILTANDKHSCHLGRILHNQFKSNFLRNEKFFSQKFIAFLKFTKLLKIFEKNINLTAEVFAVFFTPKNVVTWVSKRSCLRTPFFNELVNGS